MAIELDKLYYAGHDHGMLHLAASNKEYELPSFLNIKELFGKALKRIFDTRKPDVDPDLMEITYAVLEEAVNVGSGKISYGQPNYELAEQLRQSTAIFSAAKSLQQAKELASLLVRPDGKTRNWEEFQTLSKSIDENYNQNWLKVEYNTGIKKATAAVQWKKIEANADLYPNLKYTPSRAATPSEEHKVFWGIIKPIQDKFWIKHYPPSRYACQCGVEPTDDDPEGSVPEDIESSPGLDNNPGMTGQLFSDSHPYIAKLTPEELKFVMKKAKQYVTKRNEGGSRPG